MNFKVSDLLLYTLYVVSYDVFYDAFVCFIGMGELILVENFMHCGFCGVATNTIEPTVHKIFFSAIGNRQIPIDFESTGSISNWKDLTWS